MKAKVSLQFDAIVLGAGIAGLGVARALVLKNKKVLVLEKKESGTATSHASGILDPFVDLDCRPEILALTIPSVKKYPGWIHQIETETGLQTGYQKFNLLYVAFSKADEQCLKRFQKLPQVRKRMSVTWLNPKQVHQLEPGISSHACGGLYIQDIARVRPSRLIRALQAWLRRRGVSFQSVREKPQLWLQNNRAVGIRLKRRSLRAAAVVGCLGAWAGAEKKNSKLHEEIRPIRGQILIYPRTKPLRILLHTTDGGYLIPWTSKRILAGSTVEEKDYNPRVTSAGKKKIQRYAESLLPELRGVKPVQAWAGLRPQHITGRPRIGKTSIQGYYVANGYFRCGILIGIHAGELLVQAIQTGKVPVELRPFSCLPALKH